MAEVVYLKLGEKRPKGDGVTLVCRRRGSESVKTGANGSVVEIRTRPELIADTISSLLQSDMKIYVQGVPSRAEVRTNRLTLTVEDLQREDEISSAIEDGLRSVVRALTLLDEAPAGDVVVQAERLIDDYLSAAPPDDYGQRRALEKLNSALLKARHPEAGVGIGLQLVIPRLSDTWKQYR